MSYRLGLDIGIKSVGYCVMAVDKYGEPTKILKLGSRIFEAAEKPDDGKSLAEKRRLARGLRRRLRRRVFRLQAAKELFEKNGIKIVPNHNVNILRVVALDELVSERDFANIILLLIKNRGFKSNRKHIKKGDDGKLLAAIEENTRTMEENGYRTVGEMLLTYYAIKRKTRNGEIEACNIRNKGDYSKTVLRAALEDELKLLFEKQRLLGNKLATVEIEKRIIEIFNWQRNFDQGPGLGSPYSGSYDVGYCEFEEGEKRAPKASYSFEYAMSLQKINNLTLLSDYDKRVLTMEERQIVIELLFKKKEVKFADVRKALKLENAYRFNLATYNIKEAKTLTYEELLAKVEKSKFIGMPKSKEIQSRLTEANAKDTNLIDNLSVVLSNAKSDEKRIEALNSEEFSMLCEEEIDNLLAVECDKFGHLSFKALKAIIPYLEQGFRYSDACKEAGYNHSLREYQKQKLLNTQEIYDMVNSINSPVVKRSISQTIKVINAIIREYGSPVAINVELARDVGKSREERDKEYRDNKSRFLANEQKRQELVENFGIKPNRNNLIIYKLYQEQLGKCIYSGEKIESNRLFEQNYVQVDHIIPYSRSFNDSFNNKVLVLAKQNQDKKNMTPYEWLRNTDRWSRYEEQVIGTYIHNTTKRSNLLKKTVDTTEWKSRALNDTRYASRFILNLLQDRLVFDDSFDKKKRVFAVNGNITAIIRHNLGINKVRADGDKHHAVDACIIACTTDGIIQRLTAISQNRETYINEDLTLAPYPTFVDELNAKCASTKEEIAEKLAKIGYSNEEIEQVKPIFVSRMPKRKGTGAISKSIIYSDKKKEDNIIIKRVPITELKLNKEQTEIVNYYNKESDLLSYNVLLERLKQFDNKADKAFAVDNPIYKPRKDGTNGNQIKKVKLVEKRNYGVELNNGFAKNDSMVRVDIYTKDKKYYGVPVYLKDVYDDKGLPKKAATPNKVYQDWTVMDDSYTFKFSLYPNDIIVIKSKKSIQMTKVKEDISSKLPATYDGNEELLYYTGFDIESARILFIMHDNCYKGRTGITTLEKFEKYTVDILGNVSKVKV